MCQTATYAVPENKGFWSIPVYGSDGYMKSDNSILNGNNVKLNQDGTFTAYFGSKEACGDKPNRLDVTDGWMEFSDAYLPPRPVSPRRELQTARCRAGQIDPKQCSD